MPPISEADITEAVILDAIRDLLSLLPSRRDRGEEILNKNIKIAFPFIVAILKDTRTRHRHRCFTIAGKVNWCVLFVFSLFCYSIYNHMDHVTYYLFVGLWLLVPIRLNSLSYQYYALTKALSSIDDTQIVLPLVEALGQYRFDIPNDELILLRLLPRFAAEYPNSLDITQSRQFNYLLRYVICRNVALAVAIIDVYSIIGNSDCLKTIRKLAKGEGKLPSNVDQRRQIIEAAQACEPILAARVEEMNRNNLLLRPSDAVENDQTKLLRPLDVGAVAASENLLRAVDGDNCKSDNNCDNPNHQKAH